MQHRAAHEGEEVPLGCTGLELRVRLCARAHTLTHADKSQGETNAVLVIVLFNVAQL